jgi:polyhydroxybutyrate depolymerase
MEDKRDIKRRLLNTLCLTLFGGFCASVLWGIDDAGAPVSDKFDMTNASGAFGQKKFTEAASGDKEFKIKVGEVERHYIVHVPPQYDKKTPVPVVVMLHGGGGTGKAAAFETGWGEKADKEGFLAVFPDAMPPYPDKAVNFRRNPQLWNDGSDRFYEGHNVVDDIAFINAMLDDIERNFTVDAGRVFLSGFSNGGSMCFRAGEALCGRVAAIAPTSSACWSLKPELKRPIPMCYITGTEDPLNLIDGGMPKLKNGSFDPVRAKPKPPVRESINRWIRATGSDPSPISKTDENGVHIETYGQEGGKEIIVFVTIDDMGHTWAGGRSLLPEAIVGKRSDKMKAADFIWTFFQKNPLGKYSLKDGVR